MPFLAPIIGSVAGAISGFAASGWAAAALVRIGGTLLITAASRALIQHPNMNANRTVTVREPVHPREIVYGQTRKGGTIVYMLSTGPAPAYPEGHSRLHIVVAISQGPIHAINSVYFDGKLAIDAAGVVQAPWTGLVTIDKRLGDANQSAFAELITASAGAWSANHRLRGVAAVYLQLAYSADAFPGGLPNISFDVEGKGDVLDPRTGLRGYTRNAALCVADYMALADFGLGATIGAEGGIASADLIEAANICDEAVTLAAGGTEPRYTLNGVVSLSDSPKAIVEAMLSAMAGQALNPDGTWRIRAGAYRSPTVDLITDDARGPMKLTTRRSRAQNFNAVRGQFVSPENDWQPDDFPAVTSTVYLAEDSGERIWDDITLPFTISGSMAQRLAKIHLERRRRQMQVDLPAKLQAWRATVGDTATFTYSRWGFAAKPFVVDALRLAFDGRALVPDITLIETSPLVYDWSTTEEQIYAAAPRSTLPSAFDVPVPDRPVVTEGLYITREGAGVKVSITISWSIDDADMVDTYEVQGQPAGGAWRPLGRPTSQELEVLDVTPGGWTFRVRAVSGTGVRSDWATIGVEIEGLAALPQPVTGVSLQSAGGLAVLKWDRHPDLDVRIGGAILIRHSAGVSPGWQSSVSMDRVQGGQAIAVVSLKPGTYLLAAEDSGGHIGPVTPISTDGAGALTFSPVGLLHDDTLFAGPKSGTAVLPTGGLVLTSTGTFGSITLLSAVPSVIWPDLHVRAEGSYEFGLAMDLTTAQRIRLRSAIQHSGKMISDRISRRSGRIRTWASFSGVTGAETDVVMEASTTPDNPASGGAVWTPYSRVDAHEMTARGVRGRAWLRTSNPSFTPRVTLLELQAEVII